MKEKFDIKGRVRIRAVDIDGNLICDKKKENLIVTAGKTEVLNLITADTSGTTFDYIAIGTDSSAPAAGDTVLGSEYVRGNATGSVAGTTASFAITLGISNDGTAINEYGIFNDSSSGTMLSRTTASTLNLDSGSTVTVNWDIIAS